MSAPAKRSVTVTLDGTNKSTKLPLLSGSVGPDVFDIRKLYGDLGVFTYDPGYGVTASCDSKITYIDGDQGILLYRGYPIEQLAESSTYLEVAYLLLKGELPTTEQFDAWRHEITYHTFIHENVRKRFLEGFHYDAHPMGMLVSAVAALSTAAA